MGAELAGHKPCLPAAAVESADCYTAIMFSPHTRDEPEKRPLSFLIVAKRPFCSVELISE